MRIVESIHPYQPRTARGKRPGNKVPGIIVPKVGNPPPTTHVRGASYLRIRGLAGVPLKVYGFRGYLLRKYGKVWTWPVIPIVYVDLRFCYTPLYLTHPTPRRNRRHERGTAIPSRGSPGAVPPGVSLPRCAGSSVCPGCAIIPYQSGPFRLNVSSYPPTIRYTIL